jgi:hypothetical protein
MTTIAEIITDAYRETNLIARGATETAGEQAEGLRLLDRYIQGLFGNEAGDNLQEMMFGLNNVDPATYNNEFESWIRTWYFPVGLRLRLNLTQPENIKLDPTPENGAMFGIVDASNNLATFPLTLQGNGSKIEGATSITLNTSGQSGVWFYRADKAEWMKVINLGLADESPFPSEFDDLLIIGLAMRLDPRNGTNLSDMSMIRYQSMLKKFRARYSQVQEKSLDWSLSRMEGQRRFRRGYSLAGEFERGSIFRW